MSDTTPEVDETTTAPKAQPSGQEAPTPAVATPQDPPGRDTETTTKASEEAVGNAPENSAAEAPQESADGEPAVESHTHSPEPEDASPDAEHPDEVTYSVSARM